MSTSPVPKEVNWAQSLAFEVALAYYSPRDLCLQYELPEHEFERIVQMPDFQRAVNEYKREIDDEGIAFKLRARKQAELALEELASIAFDNVLPATDRIRAIEMLCRYAGFEQKSKDADQGVKLIIQTNLSVNQGAGSPGVYEITVPKDEPAAVEAQ